MQSNLDSNEFPVPPSHFNPLNKPSPLGLRLKKSPSLLELIQTRMSQCNKNNGSLSSENLQVGNKTHVKARVGTSGPIDKLKASNFPALLLRIGQWEVFITLSYSYEILRIMVEYRFAYIPPPKLITIFLQIWFDLLSYSYKILFVRVEDKSAYIPPPDPSSGWKSTYQAF